MTCLLTKKRRGGCQNRFLPRTRPALLRQGRPLHRTLAGDAVFLEGTVSRVEAMSLFGGLRKERKMQSLRRCCLASALHLRQGYLEFESSDQRRRADKSHEPRTKSQEPERFARKPLPIFRGGSAPKN